MKKILMVGLLAAATVFTSCNKDEGPKTGDGNDKATVILSVLHEQDPASRAEAGKVANNTPLTLGEGYIFFVEQGDVIVRYLKMINGNASNDNEYDLGDITAGKATIENVLTSAKKCYIFANIPTATKTIIDAMTIQEGLTKIDAVLEKAMQVNDLYDAAGKGIAKMPQLGVGNVIPAATDADPMTASVDVYAMGSRIQIEKITGQVDIKDFKVDGIFVNNYFEQMDLTYVLNRTNVKDHGTDVTKYNHDATSPYLPLNLSDYSKGALAVVTPQASTVEAVPDNGAEVWAYNIWPTEGVAAADQEAVFPHVVIALSDVKYEDSGNQIHTVAGPLYLTVKGMKDTGNQPVAAIKKGNSYTFPNIKFKFSDLTTVPEVDAINAEVTINMMQWKDNEVEEIL